MNSKQFKFIKGEPTLLSGEDYHKINQYNDVNLRYLTGDLADEPLYNTPIISINKDTILSIREIMYIATGSKIQVPNGKIYTIDGHITSIEKGTGAYMTRVVCEIYKGVYQNTNKQIPVFDRNGKLIVKIIIE